MLKSRQRKKPKRIVMPEFQAEQNISSDDSEGSIEVSYNLTKRGPRRLEERYPLLFHPNRQPNGSNQIAGLGNDLEEPAVLRINVENEEVGAAGGEPEDSDEPDVDEDDIISLADDEMVDWRDGGENFVPDVCEENDVVVYHNDSELDWDWDNPPPPYVCPYGHLMLPQQDINAGLHLAEKVASLSNTFQMRLLRMWTEHQTMTNDFKSDMLKAMKTASAADLVSLPNDHRSLNNCIPLSSLSCWIIHICTVCEKKFTYRYRLGHRHRTPFPFCHKVLDYTSDHYLVTDVSEVLALVLPSVWQWRSEEYLPPHIKKVMVDNKMDFRTDVTLSVSSDGVQFFKSSSLSIWPMLAYVDGVPYHIQRRSIIFLGALAARGECKSYQVNSMIEDVLKQIERLNNYKFSWMYKGQIITSRLLVSRVIADSPARSDLQGVNHHNAAFGCNYCYHFQSGHYFMHFEEPSRARRHDDFIKIYSKPTFDSMTVEKRKGIRWKSPFARLPFDLIDGFPPDIMHAGYAGVMKLLIGQWLSKPTTTAGEKDARLPYQLTENQIRILDDRLLKIRPPERTTRRPRELSKVGMWKAHELSMFMFHYGPIILRDMLPSEYYEHFIEFVAGIVFLSCKITPEHLSEAQKFLDSFSLKMRTLYPTQCQRFNVHLLRHLPRFCELHGILPLFSMYPFESENHRLGKFVNNPQGVILQMYRKSMQKIILNCHADAFTKHTQASGWLDFQCPNAVVDMDIQNWQALCEQGSYYQVYQPPNGRPRIVSKSYTALQSRNSYMVMLKNGRISTILKYFVGFTSKKILAIVEEMEVSKHPTLSHIRYSAQTVGISVVPVTDFVEQVIEVPCGNGFAYSLYLNSIEHVAE